MLFFGSPKTLKVKKSESTLLPPKTRIRGRRVVRVCQRAPHFFRVPQLQQSLYVAGIVLPLALALARSRGLPEPHTATTPPSEACGQHGSPQPMAVAACPPPRASRDAIAPRPHSFQRLGRWSTATPRRCFRQRLTRSRGLRPGTSRRHRLGAFTKKRHHHDMGTLFN
jgi:hypothetical protein